MEGIWPKDVFDQSLRSCDEPLRPFHCLLLMPFGHDRFHRLAEAIKREVNAVTKSILVGPGGAPWEARVERLDWVTSSGVVQSQLWQRVDDADLVFCDITGHNPNVMFEAGVCAARKRIEQVVFLRDTFFKPDQPFDVAPFRHTTYEITSDGLLRLSGLPMELAVDAAVAFPDRSRPLSEAAVVPPLDIDFSGGHDDLRIVTPPLTHRRVVDGRLEFGSITSFSHSWATIGKGRFGEFDLSFTARFAKLHPDPSRGYIGVGFRSQNPLVPFCSVLYLNRDGSIVLAQPDDDQSLGYRDVPLRPAVPIDLQGDHRFRLVVGPKAIAISVDDFTIDLSVADLPKSLGPGLIRFQSHMAWMSLSSLSLRRVQSDQEEGQ